MKKLYCHVHIYLGNYNEQLARTHANVMFFSSIGDTNYMSVLYLLRLHFDVIMLDAINFHCLCVLCVATKFSSCRLGNMEN